MSSRHPLLLLVTLAWVTVPYGPIGCSADESATEPCDPLLVVCSELRPEGPGVIQACVDGELVPTLPCPGGVGCAAFAGDAFAECLGDDFRIFVPFATEGGRCTEGVVHACAPTDDRFLVCVDGTWANVCPADFAFPPSCSAVYTDASLSDAARTAALSCAGEGGRCGRDASYECDGPSAYRCVGGESVFAIECSPDEECRGSIDLAICGDRFYAVAGDPCLSQLQPLIGEQDGPRLSCNVGDEAVLACIDHAWVVVEDCNEGTRCVHRESDFSCE